jgi:hypothetical protein
MTNLDLRTPYDRANEILAVIPAHVFCNQDGFLGEGENFLFF